MLCETISMRDDDENVILKTFISEPFPELAAPPRPAILIFPGGGYKHHSPREAEPVALQFSAAGFQSCVLYYSVKENARYPRPMQDASRAIAHIRRNAARYNVDPERIFVLGFSAGGHLAGAMGTMYAREEIAFPGMQPGENRPAGMILCYAVLTHAEYNRSVGSYKQLLQQPDPDEEQRRPLAPETYVSASTVPAYIWHTAADKGVSVRNSIDFAAELAKHGIPYEMHIFPRGPHGTALANALTCGGREDYILPEAEQWIDEVIAWTKRI